MRQSALLCVLLCLPPHLLAQSKDWQAAEKEADRLDPRWRLHELEAARPAVPDAENSARLIKTIASKDLIAVSNAPYYDRVFKKLTPTAQLNEQQLKLIRTELAKIAKQLPEARKLKDMPRGRFTTKYTDDFISTPITEQQHVRSIADWLRHDALLLTQEKEYDRALESCHAMLHAERSLVDELILITYLIRLRTQLDAIHALERILAQGEASEQGLRAMQTVIEQEAQQSSCLPAMRGERAGYHHLFENIRTGKLDTGILTGTLPEKGKDKPNKDKAAAVLIENYPPFLLYMNQLVEITKLPCHQRSAKLAPWQEAIADTKNPVVQLLLPAVGRVHQAECRNRALLRSAFVALACERYRLKHQDWPASLDALVKEGLLAAAPADPMDNQPLRYRRTKEGGVVYSIGIDRKDNLGHIDHERPNADGVDIGMRLWNVNLRRQPPLPVVELSD